MSPDKAALLARKMADAFPASTWTPGTIAIWAQDLADLDEGRAGTAILRLRKTWQPTAKQVAPSLRDYLAVYERLDTDSRTPEACDTCDGTGWETVLEDPPAFDTPKRVPTTAVRPCQCSNGRGVQQTFDSIRN